MLILYFLLSHFSLLKMRRNKRSKQSRDVYTFSIRPPKLMMSDGTTPWIGRQLRLKNNNPVEVKLESTATCAEMMRQAAKRK